MLTGVINSCDGLAAEALEHAGRRSGLVRFAPLPPRQLQNYELVRAVNGHEADVAFLDFADRRTASAQAEVLRRESPAVARVGFLSDQPGAFDENPAPELVDAWLSMPPGAGEMNRTLWLALHRPQAKLPCPLYVFVPAKAGGGCTTISLHVADALANDLGRRTLLLDADQNSGVLELMLNAGPHSSLDDLLQQSGQLTPSVWNSAMQRAGKLDMAMNRLDQSPPPPLWTSIHKLLAYASTRYDAMVADLSETVNEGTRELIAQAEAILLVTTMELAAMKLATRRLNQLRDAGAQMDKVWLVLNRWHRHNLNRADTERLLSVKVAGVIPNDYKAFQAALQLGGFVNPDSAPGRAVRELAHSLAGVKSAPAEGHRLLRFFVK